MFESYPDVVSVEQLMKMLGIGKNKAYSLLRNRDIISLKIGRKYLIPKKAVIDFITVMCDNSGRIIDSRLHVTKGGIASDNG